MTKALTFRSTVGEEPKVCDHCGADALYSIGLVAPKCRECGEFSMSHISFGDPIVEDVDLTIIVEED